MRIANALVFVLTVILLGGCATEEELTPPRLPGPKLAYDPTESVPVDGWWSNDAVLLQLTQQGQYRRYDGGSRYREPSEVGRWHRAGYAAVWLEPYDEIQRTRMRGSLSREGDTVVMRLDEGEPMYFTEEPPEVPEDAIIGTWSGATGTLQVLSSRRYRYTAHSFGDETPVVIAGHVGTWSYEAAQLRLDPDPPNMGPYTVELDATGEAPILRTEQGDLERIVDDPL